MVEVRPYTPQDLSVLVEVANDHCALVPPTHARMSREGLETVLTRYEGLWLHHYPEDAEIPQHYHTLVAIEKGRAVGLVMVRWEPEDLTGHIPFFLAAPDVPEVADVLLFAAEQALRGEGSVSIEAGGRCPVGLGWFGLPLTWEYLIAALERAGYEPVDHWIIMVGRTDAIPIEPPRPAGNMPHVLFTGHPDRREWLIDLYEGEEIIGECHAWGIPPHLDSCSGFSDWITIEWIGIEESHRRRGLAFWLMVKQMHYHLRAGRKHVMLWTGPDNVPARGLYYRLGFSDGPETRVFRKGLT
jgi:GNAT superfamily N-acetyltransferase